MFVSDAPDVASPKLAKDIHSFTVSTVKPVSKAAKDAIKGCHLLQKFKRLDNQGCRREFVVCLGLESNEFLHGVNRKPACSQAEMHGHN